MTIRANTKVIQAKPLEVLITDGTHRRLFKALAEKK